MGCFNTLKSSSLSLRDCITEHWMEENFTVIKVGINNGVSHQALLQEFCTKHFPAELFLWAHWKQGKKYSLMTKPSCSGQTMPQWIAVELIVIIMLNSNQDLEPQRHTAMHQSICGVRRVSSDKRCKPAWLQWLIMHSCKCQPAQSSIALRSPPPHTLLFQ